MSYWNNEGKYEAEAQALQELVPSAGRADTHKGEIFRAATKIYYDLHNNGWGNDWRAQAWFLIMNIQFDEEIKQLFKEHAGGVCSYSRKDYSIMDRMIDTVIETLRDVEDAPNTVDSLKTYFPDGHFDEDWDDWDEEDGYEDY